jgi:hypothetical protein
MRHLSLPLLARIAEDTQLEAKFRFPEDTEKQLRWCAAKGMLVLATKMAHYLRTAKDGNGNPVFPGIADEGTIPNNADGTPDGCAKSLYASQEQLKQGFQKYESLLKAYSSTHEMIEFLQRTWPSPSVANEGVLTCPKGISPPEKQTAIVRQLKKDFPPFILPDGKKFYPSLTVEKLRIGNYVSVPHGSEYKTVRINGITRRKIGYATASGSGEKYARLHDVKPLLATGENLTAVLHFKQVDEYAYDGKNYYDNVYHEKVLDDKGDLIQFGLKDPGLVNVQKYEIFPDVGVRATAFVISSIANPEDCFVKLEMLTLVGRILHVYYPKFIHEVQNYVDFFLSVRYAYAQVYLDRKTHSHPSDYK